MEKIKQFVEWFRGLGGAIDDHHEAVLKARHDYITEPAKSFKDRPEEVKRRYNHKFKKNNGR